jgi:hypothetical protein
MLRSKVDLVNQAEAKLGPFYFDPEDGCEGEMCSPYRLPEGGIYSG